MSNFNRVIQIGNITKDLDLKSFTKKDGEVGYMLNFSIAVTDGYGDKKTTDFFNVKVWNKIARNVYDFCGKGSSILIEGKLKNGEKYSDKNGVEKFGHTFIDANNVQFLNTKKDKQENFSDEVKKYEKEKVSKKETVEQMQESEFDFSEPSSDIVSPF